MLEQWLLQYKDLYNTDSANWADFKKVHLLLRKLGIKFINYILPTAKKKQQPDIHWSSIIVDWIIQPQNISLP